MVIVGDLVTDVLVEHHGPIRAGSDTDATIRIAGGGQAANTAAWLAHAGRAVTLVAAVGDDQAGRDRVAELEAAGVSCAVRVHPDAATGSVVVLTQAAERTMITDRGASLLLDPDHVTAAVTAVPADGHLHLSGYPLLHSGSRPAGLAALTAAAARGLTVSVDAASAAPLRDVGADLFLAWVRGIDLLLCNAAEAEVLAGPGSPAEQAERLARQVRNVVVKRGADGALWHGPDGAFPVAAEAAAVRDPTGAGDAFAAGLLAAWCSGAGPEASLRAGTVLGATAVSGAGARPAIR
ncbi:carbohydrate kinase family protein [Actinoplanes flavus]|uniref:Ribokinase n=1 Tax=Actinoplanes flavus TaxID=2820290 RepID=A0ABS3UCB7_9ACTN|nr:PfkB family carbohydrate kinase [Actinoplanes flavus]MBO3736076.1 ribokinase [Actinoplanes flavus]